LVRGEPLFIGRIRDLDGCTILDVTLLLINFFRWSYGFAVDISLQSCAS